MKTTIECSRSKEIGESSISPTTKLRLQWAVGWESVEQMD